MSERPAVLIVVENLPVPLDRRVWQEACALRDRGYDVTVICPKMRGYDVTEEDLDGIHIYRHWISGEAGKLGGFLLEYASALWGEARLTWKAWRRRRFQVIHLCNPPDLLFLVAWPWKLRGVKVIYDVHDVWPEMFEAKFERRGLLYWLVRAAERATYACADVVLATNESVRRIAIERGRKEADRVFVVRTAPNVSSTPAAMDPGLRKGRRYLVGYVGVMGDADGVDYLIEAAAYLVRERGRADVHFLLMGSGPEYTRLVAQRDRLGLETFVDMPGRVSDEQLFTALQTMDVGVSCDPINAYNHHCTMNKVLEYMAFGRAQVMFDLEEGRASAGDAAVYVPENSAARLAMALEALLDDAERREAMGLLGAARLLTQLNWQSSVAELYRAYDRALG
jgi:glycosyltransferase involved in cell wall biosynthesis